MPKQYLAWEKLLDAVTKYLLFGGGAGGGKTWFGCEFLLTMCYRYPNTKWFIGRKELKRLMMSSYETWKKVCKFHNIPVNDWRFNGDYHTIEFFNGAKIDLLDLAWQPADPDYERFGSSEYTGGWIEEAGEVRYKCFDVLKTRIGRHLNKELGIFPKMLLTANPTKNWLKSVFYTRWKSGELPLKYAFIQSLYRDNFYTAQEYGENLNEIDDKITKQRLKEGNWDYDESVNGLFNSEAVKDLFTNTADNSNEKFLTGDIARFGGDAIVLMCWKGFKVYRIEVKYKQGLDKTEELIEDLARDEQIPYSHILVDEDGIGGGVVDHLQGIKGFTNNGRPLERVGGAKVQIMKEGHIVIRTAKENFLNLRSQCYFMLAEVINNHKLAIECDDTSIKEKIEQELSCISRKEAQTTDTKFQVVSKQEIKVELGRSPDFSDTLMMRMWFELSPYMRVVNDLTQSVKNRFR